MSHFKVIVAVGLLSMFVSVSALATEGMPDPVATVTYPLGNASLYDFKSEKAGRDLQILISLPGSYHEKKDKHYPVIYAVDGQWHFTLAGAAAGALHYDRGWRESIIVGITWKGTVQDAEHLRYQDFTPTTIESAPETGRADRYLDFMQSELLPYVARHYRVSDDRVLVGSSLGGLLALYCLYTRPELFSDYIASTPATWWDDGVLDQYRLAFDGHAVKRPVRLYMGRGGLEHQMQAGADTMARQLQEAAYPNLEVGFAVVEGTGHAALNPEVITRGLQFIFRKEWIPLSAQDLAAFAGSYRGEREGIGEEFQVRAVEGKLQTTDPDSGEIIELVAVEPNRFFLPGRGAEVVFERSGDGPASGMTVRTPGHDMEFERTLFHMAVDGNAAKSRP